MVAKKLALVVHGIGEQEAGETLAQLVGGAGGDRPHTVTTDTRMFRDIHSNTDERAIDLFPCHIHRVTTHDSKVIFAEVFWAVLSIGLGVAKDIAGYFSEEPDRQQSGIMQPVLRHRINNRLCTVTSNLVEAENPDGIVIISHLQGTVVAVEALRDGLLDAFLTAADKKKLSLVTMGSPVGHITVTTSRHGLE